jgi:hypothetical protein
MQNTNNLALRQKSPLGDLGVKTNLQTLKTPFLACLHTTPQKEGRKMRPIIK